MARKGAQAALKGYRLQALYILWAILNETDPMMSFQPEGKEDLSVFREQHLIKSIQIKAHSGNLSLASFNPQNKQSFFHRCVQLKNYSRMEIGVVSFGPIGPEIDKAWGGPSRERESVTNKLWEYGLERDETDFLFTNLKWQQVQESAITDEVFSFLQNSLISGNPESTFDLLIAWIYKASEARQRITKEVLIDKIHQVGRYFTHRAAHHDEWFSSIEPFEEKPICKERRDELDKEFRAGVSVRYEHISAGLDVEREERLTEIEKAFANGSKTVIVHGASGQGKTALVFRYFKDYLPNNWCYSIKFIRGRKHAARVATALAGHLRVVNAPLFLHIDVSPSDQEWEGLVKDLLSEPNIRIIVSIRQEDLSRAVLSKYEHGPLATVDLTFDENEARGIYKKMCVNITDVPYPTFEEAWQRFGEQGPLLEFVYFLTHTQTLRERLTNQVQRLRDEVRIGSLSKEELAFLRVCSIATAFQARVNLKSLSEALELRDTVRTFMLFEKEYLLRKTRDGLYVEAMHPIRSEILTEIMTDPTLNTWLESAQQVVAHLPEEDLEAFLLCTFSRRHEDSNELIEQLKARPPATWGGMAGAGRAILWLGLKNYLQENRDVISEARELVGDSAIFILDFDVARAMSKENLGFLEMWKELNPHIYEEGLRIRKNQSPVSHAFESLKDFLTNTRLPTQAPDKSTQWLGLAFILFWAARLGVTELDLTSIGSFTISSAIDEMSLRDLAFLVYSIKKNPEGPLFSDLCLVFEDIVHRFSCENLIVNLDYKDSAVSAFFVVNSAEDLRKKESDNIIHEKTMTVVDILGLLFPEKERIVSKGFGHMLPFLEEYPDDTEKNMPRENVMHGWLTSVNSTLRCLSEFEGRPANWTAYVDRIMRIRLLVIEALESLVIALNSYFSSKRNINIFDEYLPSHMWDQTKNELSKRLKLPQSAVDEWGFVSEDKEVQGATIKQRDHVIETYEAQLSRYLSFHKTSSNLLGSLRNFFTQAVPVIFVHALIGRKNPKISKQQIVALKIELGYGGNIAFLSAHNLGDSVGNLAKFQESFKSLFAGMVSANELSNLEDRETTCYRTAWAVWNKFAMQPKLRFVGVQNKALLVADEALDRIRRAIARGPKNAGSVQYKLRILDENRLWEGKTAVWLALDVAYPPDLYDAYGECLKLLNKAIGQYDHQSMSRQMVSIYWCNIIVVPRFGGKNFARRVWRVPSVLLDSKIGNISESFPLLYSPQEVEREVFEAIGVITSIFNIPLDINKMGKAIEELLKYAQHAADLNRIFEEIGQDKELNDLGYHVLKEYIAMIAKPISTSLQLFFDTVEGLIVNDLDSDIVRCDDNLLAASAIVLEIYDKIKDVVYSGEHFMFRLESMRKWSNDLIESNMKFRMVELLYIASDLEVGDGA